MHTSHQMRFLAMFFIVANIFGCASQPKSPHIVRTTKVRPDSDHPLDLLKFYPIPSRDLGEEGKCIVSIYVGFDGFVRDAKVVQSTGFATLDDACVKAMLSARYIPATEDGNPVGTWVSVPIEWKLTDVNSPTIRRGYVLRVGDDYYPESARKLHEEGDCVVNVFVIENGTPTEATIYKSTGFEALDQACLSAALRAEYTPGSKHGVVTALPAYISMSWRLGKY